MPKSTFPNVPNHPDLRLCWPSQRGCGERLMPGRFCRTHTHLCLTCCASRLNRRCGLEPREVPPQPKFTDAEREERDADLVRIRADLGFRPETDAEIAESAKWREAR